MAAYPEATGNSAVERRKTMTADEIRASWCPKDHGVEEMPVLMTEVLQEIAAQLAELNHKIECGLIQTQAH